MKIQHSLKVQNTPVLHQRESNVLGTTQASFLAKSKVNNIKYGLQRNPPQCSKDISIWALCDL